MLRRVSIWMLLLTMLASGACSPRHDDNDQEEDDKKEEKTKGHRIPLIIFSGLKSLLKMVDRKPAS